jgi:hypothetical protein
VVAGAQKVKFAVVISANTEWKTIKKRFPQEKYLPSPWGEYFFCPVNSGKGTENIQTQSPEIVSPIKSKVN